MKWRWLPPGPCQITSHATPFHLSQCSPSLPLRYMLCGWHFIFLALQMVEGPSHSMSRIAPQKVCASVTTPSRFVVVVVVWVTLKGDRRKGNRFTHRGRHSTLDAGGEFMEFLEAASSSITTYWSDSDKATLLSCTKRFTFIMHARSCRVSYLFWIYFSKDFWSELSSNHFPDRMFILCLPTFDPTADKTFSGPYKRDALYILSCCYRSMVLSAWLPFLLSSFHFREKANRKLQKITADSKNNSCYLVCVIVIKLNGEGLGFWFHSCEIVCQPTAWQCQNGQNVSE